MGFVEMESICIQTRLKCQGSIDLALKENKESILAIFFIQSPISDIATQSFLLGIVGKGIRLKLQFC